MNLINFNIKFSKQLLKIQLNNSNLNGQLAQSKKTI